MKTVTFYISMGALLHFVKHIYYILYRSLTSYRLRSPTLRFVNDYIKLYNVWERRVHLTEASAIGFVQNLHCILWTFWGYRVQPGVSRGALRQLVLTTLYVLYSLVILVENRCTFLCSNVLCCTSLYSSELRRTFHTPLCAVRMCSEVIDCSPLIFFTPVRQMIIVYCSPSFSEEAFYFFLF